jgi:hypothetical protein
MISMRPAYLMLAFALALVGVVVLKALELVAARS